MTIISFHILFIGIIYGIVSAIIMKIPIFYIFGPLFGLMGSALVLFIVFFCSRNMSINRIVFMVSLSNIPVLVVSSWTGLPIDAFIITLSSVSISLVLAVLLSRNQVIMIVLAICLVPMLSATGSYFKYRDRSPSDKLNILIAQLGSFDMKVQFDAGTRMQEIYGEDGFVAALSSSNARSRAMAVRFLGSQRHAVMLDHLVKMLSDPDEHVKIAAVVALGEIGNRNACKYLISLETGKDEMLRGYVEEAKKKLSCVTSGVEP